MMKCHLFICTNSPNKPNKCGSKNAELLRQKIKDTCKEKYSADVASEIRINSAGCLGQCERGIAAVMYPEGQWFYDLKYFALAAGATALSENEIAENKKTENVLLAAVDSMLKK
jgi:predicted metal-binding protein